jgi:hypothetical protein
MYNASLLLLFRSAASHPSRDRLFSWWTMNIELTEIQQITLRDILVTTGLTTRQVEDIFLLLSFKRKRVQLAFYYRAQGMTHEEVSERVNVAKSTAFDMLISGCEDVSMYLRGFPNF